jgi:hypothetical protein
VTVGDGVTLTIGPVPIRERTEVIAGIDGEDLPAELRSPPDL